MKFIYTIVFISLSFFASAQKVNYPLYSPKDTTFTFSFSQSIILGRALEDVEKMKLQVENLERSGAEKDIVIKKLQLRDTLLQQELMFSLLANKDLKSRLDIAEETQSTYKKLVFSAEEQLKAEKKQQKIDLIWKNVYKYGYPILIGTVTYFILNK